MRQWSHAFLGGLVLTLCGCVEGSGGGVISDGDGDGDGEASSHSSTTYGPIAPEPSAESTTLPATTDTGEPSGSTGSEGTDGGTETGDSTGGEPPSVCDPQPEGAPFWLAVDWDEADPFLRETVELDVGCVVSSLASADGILSVGLDCDDAAHTLDVADLGPIDLVVGDTVTLRVHDSQPWWRQVHVVMLRNGAVVVAGMTAESLPEGAGGAFSPAGTFFEPLGVAVEPDVCDPEPLPEDDPEGCMFLCPPVCTQDERQALLFSSGNQSQVVYDGGFGSVDGLALAVGTARAHVQVLCSDTPSARYRFLAMRMR
jgi:hypothetical protein